MKLDKHILSIVLVIQVALPQRLIIDVFRLPQLAVHFIHHNQDHQESGFIQFIQEHYSNQEHFYNDLEEHETLPFHHHLKDGAVQLSASVLFNSFIFQLIPVVFHSTGKLPIYNIKNTSQYFASIWQPPQLV